MLFQQKLQNLTQYNDVYLITYNSPYAQKILGCNLVYFADIKNNSVPILNKTITCHLCQNELSDHYFQWKICRDEEPTDPSFNINLDLCQNCNTPKHIYDFIFNTNSCISKLTKLIMPSHTLSYEMFFLYIIMEENERVD